MILFWKPCGRPVNIHKLKNGQHVEGYYKRRFDTFWKKIPYAEISIKEYPGYKEWTIMDILIPGNGGAIRMGINYGGDETKDESSYRFRLYDGFRYAKPRKRRFP